MMPSDLSIEKQSLNEANLVFALDIGTRSIVGIVGEKASDDRLKVLFYEEMEHPGRAMKDGQVENIEAVGRIVAEVKRRLEIRTGCELKHVAVAAAGRMLRTVRVSAKRTLQEAPGLVEKEMILGLEGEAIELAHESIKDMEGDVARGFYCVGYSIVEYRMDDHPIANLLGHTCTDIGVELLAAFLPYSVVESLYAAIDASGLEVVSLTLEPIAAINVLIPSELRLLNLALVDIGAGTSDIAISKGGAITAYDMATTAGDELTEAIIQEYLVDFPTAERLKRQLGTETDTLVYLNILGMEESVSREDVLQKLDAPIAYLANTISESVLEANDGASPAAVFVIGGGSLIPTLAPRIAEGLGIAQNKVSAGGTRMLKNIVLNDMDTLKGAMYVTPLGIAYTAITQEYFQFFGVTVNERRLKLLNAREMRMLDVLLLAGYRVNQIMGRWGRNLIFTLNDVQKVVRGQMPVHAIITRNGEDANIETMVSPGDVIAFTPAADGAHATATPLDFHEGTNATPFLNDVEVAWDAPITSGDVLIIREDTSKPEPQPIANAEKVKDEKTSQSEEAEQSDTFITYQLSLNGQVTQIPFKETEPLLVMHLLEYAGVDAENAHGNLDILVNGKSTGFLEPIQNGDRVDIRWGG